MMNNTVMIVPKPKVLVIGGLGFFGSNFVNLHVDKADITILDAFTYAARKTNLERDVKIVKANIFDEPLLLKQTIVEGNFDAIINFAAETHVDNSITGPGVFLNTNYIGVFNILECLRGMHDNVPRFLHISTDEVYGDANDYGIANENTAARPSSPYSASKAAADMLIGSYRRTYGMSNLFIYRFTNLVGKNQFPEKLIPKFIQGVLTGKKLPLYGEGNQVREWTPVELACNHVFEFAKSGSQHPIRNISIGLEMTNKEMLAMVLSILAPHDKIENHLTSVKDRPGHDFAYHIDTLYEIDKVSEGVFKYLLSTYIQHYKKEFNL